MSREVNLTYAYILGGVGLITNWYTLILGNLRLGQTTGEVSRAEVFSMSIALLVSLALIIGSTGFIVYKLWPNAAKRHVLTPEQTTVGCFASVSLIIATAIIIKNISLFSIAAVALGINALMHSYKEGVKDMPDLQNYRIISFVAIAIVLISMTLPVVSALNR